jgi:hypothetical protein
MRPHNPHHGTPRRRRHPGFEGLEARDLPSTTPLATGPVSPKARPGAAMVQAPPQSPARELASAGQGRAATFPDPAVIANSLNLLYGPGSPTPRTPTPHEARREVFTARWIGTYIVGSPRFNDRASTIHLFSKHGGSNTFLKGKLDMALFPPADPQATPTPGNPFANQVTGIVGMFPQNALQTGGLLIYDIVGPPASGSDPHALPTHLTWTNDAFASAGNFVNPGLDFFQGTGTLDIHYIPDRHPHPGSLGSGRMIASFQGALNYSQLYSAVSKVYS